MTTRPRFSTGRVLHLPPGIGAGLAGRSSAFEHPGRSIAANTHDSKWHDSERFLQRGKFGRNPSYFGLGFAIEEKCRERQGMTLRRPSA